jgi:hypothetical protein
MATSIRPWWPEVAEPLADVIEWVAGAQREGPLRVSMAQIHMARAALNRAERALVAHMPTGES